MKIWEPDKAQHLILAHHKCFDFLGNCVTELSTQTFYHQLENWLICSPARDPPSEITVWLEIFHRNVVRACKVPGEH